MSDKVKVRSDKDGNIVYCELLDFAPQECDRNLCPFAQFCDLTTKRLGNQREMEK